MKVLLVDDEPDFAEQAKLFLEKGNAQFEIDTAISADKALKMLNDSKFDAIVSDYQMPKMDGLEFMDVVREEKGSKITFICLT